MVWLAVDPDNREWVYDTKPWRDYVCWMNEDYNHCIELPRGTIKKLIGRDLTWRDNAVELK